MSKKTKIGFAIVLIFVLILIIFGKNLFKNKNIEDEYLKIFSGRKVTFNNKRKKLNEILEAEEEVDFYSFVDFDNDSHKELFVKTKGKNVSSYVFDLQGSKIFGYLLDESVVANSVDGYSSIAGEISGWVKYTFNNGKFKKEKIIYHDILNKKCEYRDQEISCDEIVNKEIEFLGTVKELAETIQYSK